MWSESEKGTGSGCTWPVPVPFVLPLEFYRLTDGQVARAVARLIVVVAREVNDDAPRVDPDGVGCRHTREGGDSVAVGDGRTGGGPIQGETDRLAGDTQVGDRRQEGRGQRGRPAERGRPAHAPQRRGGLG